MVDRPIQRKMRGRTLFARGRSLYLDRHVLRRRTDAHDHDFLEIVLIAGGTARHRTVWGEAPIRRGSAIVLRPGVWHQYTDCRRLVVHNCCIGLDLLHRRLRWTSEDAQLGPLLWFPPTQQRGVFDIQMGPDLNKALDAWRKMHRLLGSSTPGADGEWMGRLLILLGTVAHRAPSPMATGRPRIYPAVASAIDLIDAAPTRAWSLTELADRVRLDRSYLVRLFTAQVGVSPIAYVARQRLQRAAGLLRSTSLDVQQIAVRVGYDDASYFARRFRAEFGVSPTAYRKQHV